MTIHVEYQKVESPPTVTFAKHLGRGLPDQVSLFRLMLTISLAKGSRCPVGGALRSNPFPPTVPCHRIIASTLFIGGFFGKWGIENPQVDGEEQGGSKKMIVLQEEGVVFGKDGFLKDKALIWRGAEEE